MRKLILILLINAISINLYSSKKDSIQVAVAAKMNFNEFIENNTYDYLNTLEMTSSILGAKDRMAQDILKMFSETDTVGIDKNSPVYIYGLSRVNIVGVLFQVKLIDEDKFQKWFEKSISSLLFQKFKDKGNYKEIKVSKNMIVYIADGYAGVIAGQYLNPLSLEKQNYDDYLGDNYLAQKLKREEKEKEEYEKYYYTLINNLGKEESWFKGVNGFKGFKNSKSELVYLFAYGNFVDLIKKGTLSFGFLDQQEANGLDQNRKMIDNTSMLFEFDFLDDDVEMRMNIYQAKELWKTYKKVYKNKMDKSLYRYISTDQLAFMALSLYPGEMMKAQIDFMIKSINSNVGPEIKAVGVGIELIEVFLDEKGIERLIEGDMCFSLLDYQTKQIEYDKIEFDEETGEFNEVTLIKTEQEPVVFGFAKLGDEELVKRIFEALQTGRQVKADSNDVWEIKIAYPYYLYFTIDEGVLLVSNDKETLEKMSSKEMTTANKKAYRMYKKNMLTCYLNLDKTMHKVIPEFNDSIFTVEGMSMEFQAQNKRRKTQAVFKINNNSKKYFLHEIFRLFNLEYTNSINIREEAENLYNSENEHYEDELHYD